MTRQYYAEFSISVLGLRKIFYDESIGYLIYFRENKALRKNSTKSTLNI